MLCPSTAFVIRIIFTAVTLCPGTFVAVLEGFAADFCGICTQGSPAQRLAKGL